MSGRLLRFNTLLLTIGLFIAIWIFAINFERGDTNAAIMYILIGFLPVAIYVVANTLTLTYLTPFFVRFRVEILAFIIVPLISYTLTYGAEVLTPSVAFQNLTITLTGINLITFILYKTNRFKDHSN